jgi:hypothetical protein
MFATTLSRSTKMNGYPVFVRLQFRAMSTPYIVQVSEKDLADLDLRTERKIMPDGTTIYCMNEGRFTNDRRRTTNDENAFGGELPSLAFG